MAMIVKRFKRAFRKGGSKYKKFTKKYAPKTPNHSSEIVCYECNKPGHIKPKCPTLKKKNKFRKDKSKKAMAATWSDSDSSSNDETSDKEAANTCMMAIEEKGESSHIEDSENEVCLRSMLETEHWY
ncbi:uncharacterized protein LOC131169503 [Hevea brasiliensis]|uniref:uncharacterized protein LOC131169503 n=1 Tax=Hevea brasiliensis TaxID=3981 RepID=UPI0025DEA2EB|nr:uncharacterized protein LOC131169503 [Hevea brasiliensis]